MKTSFFLLLLVLTSFAFGKDEVLKFNSALIQTIEEDIKKDEDAYRERPVTRGPASVETETDRRTDLEHRLDKNVRQIGPNKW